MTIFRYTELFEKAFFGDNGQFARVAREKRPLLFFNLVEWIWF